MKKGSTPDQIVLIKKEKNLLSWLAKVFHSFLLLLLIFPNQEENGRYVGKIMEIAFK
jgi:hypothetical protein